MSKLMIVRDGCYLHWPDTMWDSTMKAGKLRGSSGHVIDLDAPLEHEWCKGQEYKLASAPAGAVASKIDNAKAERAIRDLAKKAVPAPPTAAERAASEFEIMAPVEPVGSGARKSKAKE